MAFDHRKYLPFPSVPRPQRRWPNRTLDRAPAFCAVDLRDGNQALVKPMSVEQKLRLYTLLVSLGLREIEVGFPAASQPDFDFVRALIDGQLIPEHVTIQVLTQSRPELIERTFESVAGARRVNVHLYNSTSTVQREQVFGLDRAGITDIAVRGAQLIREHAARRPETAWEFQYSPESFTGTELDFAAEVVNAVLDVWRPDRGQPVVINLPATVESCMPNVYADMIEFMCEHIPLREHVRISVHTHNDRGCAVAAAELALLAGAERVEGTLFGNGERTGNMDLVTMAMNLYSQGIDPRLDLSRIADIAETVEACTEIAVHPRHPYVGEFVFTAFSGSHQDAIRKCLAQREASEPWNVAYLPIDPEDVGRRYEEVVRINSQSGKGGVLHVLERDFGITLPRWLQVEFSRVVQLEAEVDGGEISPLRMHDLFDASYVRTPPSAQLSGYDLRRDEQGVRASVRLAGGSTLAGQGHGPVEALVDALVREHGVRIEVEAFDEFALGEGTEARAMACVRVRVKSTPAAAVAFARDTTGAALQAVLTAVTRVLAESAAVSRGPAARSDARGSLPPPAAE